jgi:hypothetical protein
VGGNDVAWWSGLLQLRGGGGLGGGAEEGPVWRRLERTATMMASESSVWNWLAKDEEKGFGGWSVWERTHGLLQRRR